MMLATRRQLCCEHKRLVSAARSQVALDRRHRRRRLSERGLLLFVGCVVHILADTLRHLKMQRAHIVASIRLDVISGTSSFVGILQLQLRNLVAQLAVLDGSSLLIS